ncbi:MAG: CAP domain-containing protein [Patescibacteria group bacterium]
MEMFWKKFKINFFPENENGFKPRVLRPKILFILAIILLIVKFLNFSWFLYYPNLESFAVVTSSELVKLTNTERASLGLNPLEINERLVQAAEKKALDMLNKGYFDHISPSGVNPWFWLSKTGYGYVAAGENLARDFTDSYYLHEAWMNSSTHRSNILSNKYDEIGIAVVEGQLNGKKTILAVQFFGKPFEQKQAVQPLIASNDNTMVVSKSFVEQEETILGEETDLLKGPDVFRTRESIENTKEVIKESGVVLGAFVSLAEKSYYIILIILILILILTILINIRVQYPKLIFTVIIFILLIVGILIFNGNEFLNKGIQVI